MQYSLGFGNIGNLKEFFTFFNRSTDLLHPVTTDYATRYRGTNGNTVKFGLNQIQLYLRLLLLIGSNTALCCIT